MPLPRPNLTRASTWDTDYLIHEFSACLFFCRSAYLCAGSNEIAAHLYRRVAVRPRRHCRLCVLLLSQVVCSFSAAPSACFSCVFICPFNKCNKAPACCDSRASKFRPLAQSRAHEAREEGADVGPVTALPLAESRRHHRSRRDSVSLSQAACLRRQLLCQGCPH